jgi:pimeloyl-ACP methyl ester carboxylesterase
MGRRGVEYGSFKNGIPYVRLGEGAKDLVVFQGGPGNMIPRGIGLRMLTRGLAPLLEDHTLHLVTRKPGLPTGYTTRDMSDDYAQMIEEAFDGHVDLVIGTSYGGVIAQHFAADHADLCDHIVIAMAAHKGSEAGMQIDYRFAELMSQGRPRAASACLAEVLAPREPLRTLMRGVLWLAGSSMLDTTCETFASDILVEAQAELDHEATESLKRIRIPVLILCGAEDPYFPREYVEEMAGMIEHATLKLYEGKGHEIITDKRFGHDVLTFMNRTPVRRPSGAR